MKRTVGVLGASGYAGAELLRLLARHPGLRLAWAAGDTSAGKPLAERYPGLAAAYPGLVLVSVDEGLDKGADVIFAALPHGHAAGMAARLIAAAGELVVDLGADFRLLDPAVYGSHYSLDHPAPEQPGKWVFGLPELHRSELRGASRVTVPGCYVTTALLALAPLLEHGVIEPSGIIVDAKSGLSGAGRSLTDGNLFVQADENVSPYKVGGAHRHTPEIEQELSRIAGEPVVVTFTPHLVPMARGILATCYGQLASGAATKESRQAYITSYGGEPFIDVLETGSWPRTRAVATTNRAQVAVVTDRRTGRAVAAASTDNLVKGAAGQALQCANIALGIDETAGLDLIPPGP
jgi:N-acetyl-gamma-glutamyl-phosphate reductase